jgi:very-short-patch-repair endonuclease
MLSTAGDWRLTSRRQSVDRVGMTVAPTCNLLGYSELGDILTAHDGVVDTQTARAYLSRGELRWRVESGRWQQPCHGVVVAQSGPLTAAQRLRVAVLWAGPGAALAGLTAARLQGLRGFDLDREVVHLLCPVGAYKQATNPPVDVKVHYSRLLDPEDIHPARRPAQTRTPRSVIDAAVWMPTERGTQAILAASVQQGLTRVGDLRSVVERNTRMGRRKLITSTLNDIQGGSHALSELDFTRLVIRAFRLPAPDRQVERRDASGRRRWLDVVYERARLVIEVDGAAHADVLQYWDDMSRDNELKLAGYTVLRFPAFVIRYSPRIVATTVRRALESFDRESGSPDSQLHNQSELGARLDDRVAEFHD